MPEGVYHLLFLCTGNSARSVLAESIANSRGEGRLRAYSAGSHPAGQVNPLALELLREKGLSVEGLRSKSWDEFAAPNPVHFDLIITVCDNAAGESCPLWAGHPITAHWGLPDPAGVDGTEGEKRAAFERTYQSLERRIEKILALPLERIAEVALCRELSAIGQTTD
jgi:arsenate reductase (thioredoxin)